MNAYNNPNLSSKHTRPDINKGPHVLNRPKSSYKTTKRPVSGNKTKRPSSAVRPKTASTLKGIFQTPSIIECNNDSKSTSPVLNLHIAGTHLSPEEVKQLPTHNQFNKTQTEKTRPDTTKRPVSGNKTKRPSSAVRPKTASKPKGIFPMHSIIECNNDSKSTSPVSNLHIAGTHLSPEEVKQLPTHKQFNKIRPNLSVKAIELWNDEVKKDPQLNHCPGFTHLPLKSPSEKSASPIGVTELQFEEPTSKDIKKEWLKDLGELLSSSDDESKSTNSKLPPTLEQLAKKLKEIPLKYPKTPQVETDGNSDNSSITYSILNVSESSDHNSDVVVSEVSNTDTPRSDLSSSGSIDTISPVSSKENKGTNAFKTSADFLDLIKMPLKEFKAKFGLTELDGSNLLDL